MPYAVEIVRPAQKSLQALHPSYRALIRHRIDELGTDPCPPDVKLLKGPDRRWRLRVGDYRVIYEIDDAARRVTVLVISHRSDVYRHQ